MSTYTEVLAELEAHEALCLDNKAERVTVARRVAYRLSGNSDELLCNLCGGAIDPARAHLHQGKFIGDECCWDERLRASE